MSAIGRAPMEKMSRMIPPTPVAAPWYGSTADGWLWLSIRIATASPSPTSMTPAPSPGPTSTHGASVGKRPRCRFDDLYEQCSDHITANIASSSSVGSRSSNATTASNSSSVRPSSRWRGCRCSASAMSMRIVAKGHFHERGGPRGDTMVKYERR